MASIVIGQVIGGGRVSEEPFAVLEGGPDHERARFGRGVHGDACHEAASRPQDRRPVVPRGRFDVRQRERRRLDPFEPIRRRVTALSFHERHSIRFRRPGFQMLRSHCLDRVSSVRPALGIRQRTAELLTILAERGRIGALRSTQGVEMTKAILSLAGVMVMCVALGAQKPDADIQKLADQYQTAFNKGDAKAVTALYTADALRVTPSGKLVSGKPAIEKDYAENFAGPFKGAKLTLHPGRTQNLKADVALIEGTF